MAAIATQVPQIKRIRFMTSHPLDLSDEMIDCIAQHPAIAAHIHIPMQAGNNQVLERMRRGHTKEQYFALIDRIREKVPHCAITGDFIVGFPGETEEQFNDSLLAVERCQFDMANTAIFSPRLQTPASKWVERGDDTMISPAEAKSRLARLNKTIEQVANNKNQTLVGTTVNALVEGHSKRPAWKHRWAARTETNKLIHFEAPETLLAEHNNDLTGQFVTLTITEATAFSMLGKL
jgi:tRNA-2-methylthio-N6-dimethylallyladenosine synthase